jgi:hypothetical protein
MTATEPTVRNPLHEATELVGGHGFPHVLEPSPPAITDDWMADDPLAERAGPALVPAGITRSGATDWSQWATKNPDHADWVASNWLGGERQLGPAPAGLSATRRDLHRLAAYVIAPARHRETAKFGLRWTRDGFGTPFFGADRQIRVEGTTLVDQVGDAVRATQITTLAAAASFLNAPIDADTAAEHDSPPVGDPDAALAVDEAASHFLGSWFGMGFAALEAVRADPATVDPSRPQLWPGHFDPAIEVGDDDRRGSYGASPGDDTIDEPYLYVSAWWPDRLNIDPNDERWNAPSFTGSVMRLSTFGPGDPVEQAVEFFTQTRDALR